jgi:hypothetical protein
MSCLKKSIIILLKTSNHLPPYHILSLCAYPNKGKRFWQGTDIFIDRTTCHRTALSCLPSYRLGNQRLWLGLTSASFICSIYNRVDVSWYHIASNYGRNIHKWMRSYTAGSCYGLKGWSQNLLCQTPEKHQKPPLSMQPVTRALPP